MIIITFFLEHSDLILRCLAILFLAVASLLWAERVGMP